MNKKLTLTLLILIFTTLMLIVVSASLMNQEMQVIRAESPCSLYEERPLKKSEEVNQPKSLPLHLP